MKQPFLILSIILFSYSVFAQPTNSITNAEKKFKEAKELFIQQQYALAYPLFKEIVKEHPDNQKSNHYYLNEDARYYYIVCELNLHLSIAEDDAKHYIDEVTNDPRTELISYHLAHYYFAKEDFTNAIQYYQNTGLDNLSNDEIANEKFEKAYSLFNLKRFAEAKPLFNEIHQLADNKYYIAANYYYGFICYYNGDYDEALKSFTIVQDQPDYKNIVPYYIAEIYYFEEKKDNAIRYGEKALANGDLYYEKEMKQLLGQIYFENKDFKTALPLLEYYINNSNKISKEDLYEISYCYYQTNNLDKAINGFKQLSDQKDSLGQNSMYLLGDCYLRTNQKENARNAFQYCAYNSSNKTQQEISRFNYAKLSYELGYQDIALNEMKQFLNDYPKSNYSAEAKEILVSLLANTNNFSDALALYQSFDKPTASMQKVYPRILYGKAMEFINDQQINQADSLLTKILQLPTSNVTAYTNFWKGEIAYRLNNYDNAIRYLNQYLNNDAPTQGDANSVTAKYDLGYCWMKKENYKQALIYLEPIAKCSINATSLEQDAYVRNADCYYMNKDFAKANNMYDKVINTALSESDYALFQKAMIAGIKSAADKIKLLNNIASHYPQSNLIPDANMEIANAYMADEKFHDAIPYLNTIIKSTTDEGLKPDAYAKLGLCYYNLNDNKNALNYYQQLLQNYPAAPEANDILGNIKSIYLEEDKPDDYIQLMQKIGKNISPSEADSLSYAAAELKYNNGDCNNAIAAFNSYLSKYNSGAYTLDANYFLGDCYAKNKDWTNAVKVYGYINQQGINKYSEKATLAAATISYFELKNYDTAETYFASLKKDAVNQDNQLEALRGLVRCYYQLKEYSQANDAAKELLKRKEISTDDKSIALLVLGKSQEADSDFIVAIPSFRSCAAINKSAWGAEARYEIAYCQFKLNNFTAAEKAAMAVIKETGSYDYWVTSAYILLGDIFMQQKDYFNAKATYESVAKNSIITELKTAAQQKLDNAIAEEKANSKIIN
ncbi:MAG: tetratricopeptide repeat protein [Ferruginibacter sp.]